MSRNREGASPGTWPPSSTAIQPPSPRGTRLYRPSQDLRNGIRVPSCSVLVVGEDTRHILATDASRAGIWTSAVPNASHERSTGIAGARMNLTAGQAHEAYIGPPSEPIEVSDFLDAAKELERGSEEDNPIPAFSQSAAALPEDIRTSWTSLPQDEREKIELECRYVFPTSPILHGVLSSSPPATTSIPNPRRMTYALQPG
ncbi:hypothetical protein DICSQDRAFT_166358 [Dichomitus squalens LYAD-421 SS1]|uniref:uncharacterized protein n=1 Tax=Dichomitus squalens (strain LYAD-421) TaxID=732165 RepID=UPI00044121FB|nr:uncharacterized protein DICSQDRAFT_166358 [Dichomitus squalens LYAD-421 SS1]EJF65315.1 hypothetical protein DICSQDRAFT_166358 [Dichomitus squalens LYAD-421 SS1]